MFLKQSSKNQFSIKQALGLIFALVFLQACASPIKSDAPLTLGQKQTFHYPEELITIEYSEKAGERIEKYEARSAKELEKDETPSGRDLAKALPFDVVLKEKILLRLRQRPSADQPMGLNILITNFIRATAARQILVSSGENITALVSIVDPETGQEVTNYTIFFGRDKGGGILGAMLSSSTRSSTQEALSTGLADRIMEALY